MLFPVTLLCDENGDYIDFTEDELVAELEQADDSDIRYFTPTDKENKLFSRIHVQLLGEMKSKYDDSVAPVKAYNRRKVENWAEIQKEQLNIELAEMLAEIEALNLQAAAAKDFLEKVDIRKKADEKKKHLEKVSKAYHQKVSAIESEAEAEIASFDKSLEISPILLVNIVLKF